ncbi:nitroreductase [Maricaulis sp.]|uniref:nitroreductase family protein n=1 Tax=Maricaulis sp. TaxID=1486257 RepID=UPI003A8E726E
MNDKISVDFPATGERLAPHHASAETLALLTRRRSTTAVGLSAPGPDAHQVEHLLGIAARVPDHGKLAPWRFILFEGHARGSFGTIMGKVWAVKNPGATADQIAFEQQRLERAPLVIAVISTVIESHRIPVWEQELSAGAVCQNLLVAASAMGFGAQWLTEWYAYDPDIKDALGLRSGERIAGYIYIGSATEEVVERPRPRAHVGRWKA